MKSLIIIHGALGSKTQFDDLTKLISSNLDVHNLNMPGHGGEDCLSEFSICAFSAFLCSYIIEKELQHPMVFGYSMGGYVALFAETKKKGLFEKIIALGTKFDWSQDSATKEIKMLNPLKMAEKIPVFANQLKELHAPCDWKDVVIKTAELMQILVDSDALTDVDLSRVHCPVVVCRGSLDSMVSEAESTWAVQHMPNSQYLELESVKHPIDQVNIGILIELIRKHCL